jgi:hypothetical protein
MSIIIIILLTITIIILSFQISLSKASQKTLTEKNQNLIDQYQYKIIHKHKKVHVYAFDLIIKNNEVFTKETVFEDFIYKNTVFYNEEPEIIIEIKINELEKEFSKKSIRVLFPK